MRHVNSSDFKTHLGEYLERVAYEPVTVNKLGKPAAVLLSVAEYAYLRGLDELFRAAREAEAAAGRPLGHDEVTALVLRYLFRLGRTIKRSIHGERCASRRIVLCS